MNQNTNIATQTARFTEAVRTFTPVCASRYSKLLPFKEGIVELRQKGASYRLIRELLSTIEVSVSVDTIGSFVREVVEHRTVSRPNRRRRSERPLSDPSRSSARPAAPAPAFPFTVAPPTNPAVTKPPPEKPSPEPMSDQPPARSRTRGPRIADPSNL